jgi:hypothetical protein
MPPPLELELLVGEPLLELVVLAALVVEPLVVDVPPEPVVVVVAPAELELAMLEVVPEEEWVDEVELLTLPRPLCPPRPPCLESLAWSVLSPLPLLQAISVTSVVVRPPIMRDRSIGCAP